MADNEPFDPNRGNGGYNSTRITIAVAAIGLFVSISGSLVYQLVTLQSSVADNVRWLQDLQKVVDANLQEQKKWNSEEKEYDREVRGKVDGVDKERQDEFRYLWIQITNLINKCHSDALSK